MVRLSRNRITSSRVLTTSPLDTASDLAYKHEPAPRTRAGAAQVAQLVEQGTENPRVGGSNPSLGTILPARPLPLIQDADLVFLRFVKADVIDLGPDHVTGFQ